MTMQKGVAASCRNRFIANQNVQFNTHMALIRLKVLVHTICLSGWVHKTFLFPLPLLPHRQMSHFGVWRHLSFHKNPHKTLQQQDNSSTHPRGEKRVLPLQSTGEERKEEINSTVQLVKYQYWYKL
jgi:hypothetical protein